MDCPTLRRVREALDRRGAMKESTILLAAHRAMLDAVIDTFVPWGQRENARATATAIGVGYEPRVERRRRVKPCVPGRTGFEMGSSSRGPNGKPSDISG